MKLPNFNKKQPQSSQPNPQQPPAPGAVKPAPTNATAPTAPSSNSKQAIGALKSGSVSITDIIAPSAVEVDFKHIRVGDKFFRTLFVVDYPRMVSPNWLSMLIDYKETMNISMFIFPVESKDILSDLRRKIAEMEATLDIDAKQGLQPDPKVQAALEDAMVLREELARGLERFFQFGLYITLLADTVQELDEKTKQLSSLLASNLLVVKPATLQMEEGFKTTLPYGSDKLFITRNMDTTSVASTFPFTSYEISHPNGILYGVNTLNNSLVIIDRFSLENANSVVFGKSGSGKSFFVKLEILRSMMFDTEVLIIDPEDEYRTLCQSLGGEYITFSKDSEVKINPFALLTEDPSESQLGVKILSLHGLLKTMLGEMNPTQEALLDRALVLVYKQKGITPDPATHKNEPPILEDLYKTLLNMEEADAKELAYRLEKYVKGGFAGLFNVQSNYDVKNQLTVFSIKQLEESLRPIAMHVILDFIWNRVKTKLKKRLLIVDEAWYMMKYPDSASFLQGMAKRARKYYLGVTTLTQDIEDFLHNDYGKAIVTNSSVQVLLKQSSTGVETLAKAFNLSEGEKQFLLTAQVGEGLLFAGQNHITAQFIASQFEYDLITSKPQDIIDRDEETELPTESATTPTTEDADGLTSTILDSAPSNAAPEIIQNTPAQPTANNPQAPVTPSPTQATPNMPAAPSPMRNNTPTNSSFTSSQTPINQDGTGMSSIPPTPPVSPAPPINNNGPTTTPMEDTTANNSNTPTPNPSA